MIPIENTLKQKMEHTNDQKLKLTLKKMKTLNRGEEASEAIDNAGRTQQHKEKET